MAEPNVLPADDVLGKLLSSGVTTANGGNPAVNLDRSKRAGTYVDLFSGITTALANFQQGSAAIAGADKVLYDMRQANANQMAEAAKQSSTASGNLAASAVARENEQAAQNAKSLEITGDNINDPNSRIYKQMQISNQHVDAAQASLESYMKKAQMSLGSVIFGDTSLGDFVDAKIVHPGKVDLEQAKIHASIAASAEGNIKEIQDRYTGALQSNKAIASVLHQASEADARIVAATPDLLRSYEILDKAHIAGHDRLKLLSDMNSAQLAAITSTTSARTSIISQQRQDERESQRLRMDKIREAHIAAGTITMDDQVAAVAAAGKLLELPPERIKAMANPGYIKGQSLTAEGKQSLNELFNVAANGAADLSNPASPQNWVGSAGKAAMLEHSLGVNMLASTPGSKVLSNEFAKWKATAEAQKLTFKGTANEKRQQYGAVVDEQARKFISNLQQDNLDNEVAGKLALRDSITSPAINPVFRDTVLRPLLGTSGDYVPTGVIAAAAVQSELPTAVVVAGLQQYGAITHHLAAAKVNGNRIGINIAEIEPAAFLPTTGVFSNGLTPVKFNAAELKLYVEKERRLRRSTLGYQQQAEFNAVQNIAARLTK